MSDEFEKKTGLISIIVPVYKVEKYIDRCVESIVTQTYPYLEIILVDDGSPDDCPAMCDAWALKDNRIKVLHKQNGGLSDARNAGLAIATGEYIGFVDSDDWIAPKMYEHLIGAIMRDGSDFAACAVKIVWEDSTPDKMLAEPENCILSKIEAQKELLKERRLKQPVWYKLYRHDLIHDIPFEKGKYHEDAFWSYQAIGRSKCISIIDYVGYFYWQRDGSIMGEGYSLKRLDALEAYCQRYEYLKRFFPTLKSEALQIIWTSCIYNGQMAQRHLNAKEKQIAFEKLRKVQKKYPIRREDYEMMKCSHRCWIALAKVNLSIVCTLKNRIGVGL